MCFLDGLAVAFVCGAVLNVFRGDWANVAAGLSIAAFLRAAAWLLSREELEAEAFELWLLAHREALLNGETRSYNGQPVALETEVARFFIVFSFAIISNRISSRYFARGTVRSRLGACVCSLLTLVFGWWALPEGPLQTVWALGKNARGGAKIVVAHLLNLLVKEQLAARQANA